MFEAEAAGLQQILAEDLAPFELSRAFRGAEDAELLGLEGIDNSGNQRSLRADHGQLNGILLGEADESGNILRGNIDVHRIRCGAGVSRRDEDGAGARAVAQLPRQGVLASPVADDQDVHLCHDKNIRAGSKTRKLGKASRLLADIGRLTLHCDVLTADERVGGPAGRKESLTIFLTST